MANAGSGKEEGEGEERGTWREQGQFCFSSRDLTKLGGGKVCGTWHETTDDDEN